MTLPATTAANRSAPPKAPPWREDICLAVATDVEAQRGGRPRPLV